MKKLFAFLLAMMMIFSLAACGDNNTTDPDKDNPGVSQSGENNDSQGGENNGGETNANVSHELFDISELASESKIPDYAKKAIGTLSFCDDISRSMPQYELCYNAYMKNVSQEDFDKYIANLNANEPNDPVEGNKFNYYWSWGQINGTYFPDTGNLDVNISVNKPQ